MSTATGLLRADALDAPSGYRVRRSARPSGWLAPLGLGVIVLFAFMPAIVSSGDTSLLVNVFVLLTISTMWNLLAGCAGMVSIGQQAFIGLGAYAVIVGAINGMEPFTVIPIAAVASAVIAIPISLLVFRTKGGYFAIATWVVASAVELVISSIGGGTGHPVPGLSSLSPSQFANITYWSALAVVVVALAMSYLLLRSRLGLVLAAIRDDEDGAAAAGAKVKMARHIVFLVAALGCGSTSSSAATQALSISIAAAAGSSCTATMSNSAPADYTDDTVNITSNLPDEPVLITKHYKATTSTDTGETDSAGSASITFDDSGATLGYTVQVDVSINSGEATCSTSFTPA